MTSKKSAEKVRAFRLEYFTRALQKEYARRIVVLDWYAESVGHKTSEALAAATAHAYNRGDRPALSAEVIAACRDLWIGCGHETIKAYLRGEQFGD